VRNGRERADGGRRPRRSKVRIAKVPASVVRSVASAMACTLITGCALNSAPSPRSEAPTSTPSVVAVPQIVPGGCGSTDRLRGAVPEWLDQAGAHNIPALPYVLAHGLTAAGFLFSLPLRAGHPTNPSNKILWVVRLPRNGSQLDLTAHPLSQFEPVVHETAPTGASPGQIYPSIVDVPQAGCWHFELSWAGHRDTVDLEYV
jgi:hypothetical protein